MIKKLDQYIIKKYLSTFLFTVLIFSLIAVIIDFSDKVDEFIEEECTISQILFEYYANFIIWIDGLLTPVYALIAVIFFTSRMAYNSEVISILNAGVSFRRFLRPYLISAGIIAFILLIGNHFIIPRGNKVRLDFEHAYIFQHNDKGKKNDVHLFISPETKVYVQYYRKRDSTARDLRIEQFAGNELVMLMKAKTAVWKGPPNKWKLTDYSVHTFDGLKEDIVDGTGSDLDTTINLTPDDFIRYLNQREMMPSGELQEVIQTARNRGVGNTADYEAEIHRRTAEPVAIFILTLIGASMAARKVRGGIGLHLALGIAIGAIFIFLSKFSFTFAINDGLPPWVSMWIPNLIFSVIAGIMVYKAQS